MKLSRILLAALGLAASILALHAWQGSPGSARDPSISRRGPDTRALADTPGAAAPAVSTTQRIELGPSPGGDAPPEALDDLQLENSLARLGTALAQTDRRALEAELERLLADPTVVALVLDELVAGTWLGEEATLAGARMLLQSALVLAHEGSADPAAARRLVAEVLSTLPSVPPPERARLIEAVALARTADRVVIGMSYLRDVLDLRFAYPELRDEFAPLLANLAESAEEGGSYEEFHALLVAESGDPLAVRVGLSGLLRMGGESFLPLAEELLRGTADAALREAVLQAIAAGAGTGAAADALARLAAPEDFLPLMTFAGRPGSGPALEDAYARLVSTGDSSPDARRALVMGMQGASEETLHSIATEDADFEVRGQALITWSACHDPSPRTLSAVRVAAERALATGDENSGALAAMAAGNLLARSTGELRGAARALVLAIATDAAYGRGARRAALAELEQHAPGAIPPGLAEELE